MKVTVTTRVPSLQRNLPPHERSAITWAGVSARMLHDSWAVTLWRALAFTYPEDEWVIDVKTDQEHEGAPVFSVSDGVPVPETCKGVLAVKIAALTWAASIGHLSLLRQAAKSKRATA